MNSSRSLGRYLAMVLGSLFLSQTLAQPGPAASSSFGLEAGKYSVGFRLTEVLDHSRAVTAGNSSVTYPRPVRIYLWYPAKVSGVAQPLRFGRYLTLADDDIWPAVITGSLRDKLKFSHRPLMRSLRPGDLEALSRRTVLSHENAEALDGPFPLIVIGQGLYYESPVAFAALAEYLAGHGFVIATTPLAGTNSPIVKVDLQDLENQVRDLEFVIAQARRLSFVSPDKLGVFGFDMGGMAGLILAMRNPDVDAFMSVDSGIIFPHPSGLPRTSPDYDPKALRVPWFHAGGKATSTPLPDDHGKSLFEEAVNSDRYMLLAEEMDHVDFTSYALIEERGAMPGYWTPPQQSSAESNRAVCRYAYNFFTAYLEENTASRAFLTRAPEKIFPKLKLTLEHRPAEKPSISYAEFVKAVVDGRADEALKKLRSMAVNEPDNILLDESHLQRLTYSLSATWGLVDETIPVLEFMKERFPSSEFAQIALAESYIIVKNYPAAIKVYSKYLEQHPDNALSKSRLAWLRQQ